MKKELIGVIADDFTGASDVCSFLIESGANCVMVNDIPNKDIDSDVDVVVVALKIRSVPVAEALEKVKQAIEWLEKIGTTRIYDKYCSTFDSTEEGNIGPILDYLLERYKQQYTLVSPALPENRREVFNGYLFADGVLLSEGSMKNHPLNPMTDSFIPRLLDKQSKYKSYTLNYRLLEGSKEEIRDYVKGLSDDKHFYIVPDYIKDRDGEVLAETFGDLKVLSGSSILVNDWFKYLFPKRPNQRIDEFYKDKSPALILSGSLSQQTKKQVNHYIANGGKAIELTIDSVKRENRGKFYNLIENLSEDLLIYSSKNLEIDESNTYGIASEIESFFSDLAKNAVDSGLNKIVVAGGETSGAVITSLDFDSFIAEKNVAPGVPILRPIDESDVQIVLKSGNFGQDDFFKRAVKLMGE